jgi:hypothetical protein
VGPLPRGTYKMVNWFEHHPKVGYGAIELEPLDKSVMFGRSGFFIHGLNIANPLDSSRGCPVIGNVDHRRAMWLDTDKLLEVTA